MSQGDYATAYDRFTECIQLEENNCIHYSNRSATLTSMKKYEEALQDAEKAIALKSDWAKGYGRKGAALYGMGRLEEAKKTYEEGRAIEPDNATLKKGLEDVSQAMKNTSKNFFDQLNPFSNPASIEILRNHPETKGYFAEADFVSKLNTIKNSPSELFKMMGDQRILKAFQVILGPMMSGGGSKPQRQSLPSESSHSHHGVPCAGHHHGSEDKATAQADAEESPLAQSETKPRFSQTRSGAENKEKSPESLSKRALSDKEKELGNQEYSKKNFTQAMEHYQRALEMDATNVTILNNKAAVLYEQEDYDGCIQYCEEAVEKGREVQIDYKIIAKSFARIGSAYHKKGDLEAAIRYYQKSLTEHRSPDILSKLKQVEKERELALKRAYMNPSISEEERNIGNELFKKGDFTEALKHYQEAIKRNDEDPKNWSNRAACYAKLLAFPEAIKDCDQCLSLDPTFVKAYLRKAAIYMATKDYVKAIEVLEIAKSFDKEGRHKQEIDSQLFKCQMESYTGGGVGQGASSSQEEVLQKAMENPEVAAILTDPVMQQILSQMKQDPKALMEHMKNPTVASNIRKLMAAGIIRLG